MIINLCSMLLLQINSFSRKIMFMEFFLLLCNKNSTFMQHDKTNFFTLDLHNISNSLSLRKNPKHYMRWKTSWWHGQSQWLWMEFPVWYRCIKNMYDNEHIQKRLSKLYSKEIMNKLDHWWTLTCRRKIFRMYWSFWNGLQNLRKKIITSCQSTAKCDRRYNWHCLHQHASCMAWSSGQISFLQNIKKWCHIVIYIRNTLASSHQNQFEGAIYWK